MNEKIATCDVNGRNITATVTNAPTYPAIQATVTASLMPNGPTKAPDSSQETDGGARFDFINLDPGEYLVSVDCAGKLFGRVVNVSDLVNNSIVFFFTETSPPSVRFFKRIGLRLPTTEEL